MKARSEPVGAPEPSEASTRSPSLWRELADGSAGPVVRTAVSLALAALFAGAAFIGSYVLAEWVPQWSFRWSGLVRPTDELVFTTVALASVAYLLALTWLWTRGRNPLHEFWRAGLLTLTGAVVTILLCVGVEESRAWRGAEEVLIGGLVCLGGAAAILIWVQAARGYARRPSRNAADGSLDLRCPSCGYRMVGLRESRCPECGNTYTLDELFQRQGFPTPSHPQGTLPPPPVPVEASNGNGAAQ